MPSLEAGTLNVTAQRRPGEAALGELQALCGTCSCFGTSRCPASSDRGQPITRLEESSSTTHHQSDQYSMDVAVTNDVTVEFWSKSCVVGGERR